MSKASEEEKLSTHMLFKSLASDEEGKLQGLVERVQYLAGEPLFQEGEAGDALYIVRDGSVEIRKKGLDGSEQVIATLGKFAMIGEMSLITNAPRTATAVAVEMTRAYKIEKSVFHKMLARDSLPAYKICLAMARVLAYRLDQTGKNVVNLLKIHKDSEAMKEMEALQAKLASEQPLLDDDEGELY